MLFFCKPYPGFDFEMADTSDHDVEGVEVEVEAAESLLKLEAAIIKCLILSSAALACSTSEFQNPAVPNSESRGLYRSTNIL